MCRRCGGRSWMGWRLRGVPRYTPKLLQVHKCTEIADPGSCMQVWIPMNDDGRWRLVSIDLDMKKMTTYDPLSPTDDMGEQPPHFQVLRQVLASESTESAESTGSTPTNTTYTPPNNPHLCIKPGCGSSRVWIATSRKPSFKSRE